jgi:hypothetical protein
MTPNRRQLSIMSVRMREGGNPFNRLFQLEKWMPAFAGTALLQAPRPPFIGTPLPGLLPPLRLPPLRLPQSASLKDKRQ